MLLHASPAHALFLMDTLNVLSFDLTFRGEQSLFSPQTVKRREAGVNKCFLELELHICVVCFYNLFRVHFAVTCTFLNDMYQLNVFRAVHVCIIFTAAEVVWNFCFP